MQESQNFTLSQKHDFCVLTMHLEGGINHLSPSFMDGFEEQLQKAFAQAPTTKALVIKSSYDHFCVGVDLHLFDKLKEDQQVFLLLNRIHQGLRSLEKAPFPVISLINGNCLGGGYELALATHFRLVVSDTIKEKNQRIGLPEVLLGLIPGAGGTQRLSRLIGLQPALELISQGKTLSPSHALKAGLIDQMVSQEEEAWDKISTWVAQHPNYQQPWDQKGFVYPLPPQPQSTEAKQFWLISAGQLIQKTAGAQQHLNMLFQCMQESAHLPLDEALKVESRAFREILHHQHAQSMIRSLHFHQKALQKPKHWQALIHQCPSVSLGPSESIEKAPYQIKKIGILGAGMMGRALAFVCLRADYHVVLVDNNQMTIEQAKAELHKRYEAQNIETALKYQQLSQCQFSTDIQLFADCDLLIEAVFEDLALKHQMIKACEAILPKHAIFASNTSALPIKELSSVSQRPAQMIGLHFFSPVEKMPLLEIIISDQTAQKTLTQCLLLAKSLHKTPIVVKDGYGFFTTRVFTAYLLEAATLVAQGYPPALIEWSARESGMAMPPLKIFDEVSLKLGLHAIQMSAQYGLPMPFTDGCALIEKMLAHQRLGKANQAGFYDYHQKPNMLWDGLQDLIDPKYHGQRMTQQSLALKSTQEINDIKSEVKHRLLLIQAIEASKSLAEGVLLSPLDGDVASVLGIGFAPQTGGIFSWMKKQGQAWLIEQATYFEQKEGLRFQPPHIWQSNTFF